MSKIVKDEYIRFLDQKISNIYQRMQAHKENHEFHCIPYLQIEVKILLEVKRYFMDITRES